MPEVIVVVVGLTGQPTGAVRISFGYMSTVEDAMEFLHVVDKYFISKCTTISPLLDVVTPVVRSARRDSGTVISFNTLC